MKPNADPAIRVHVDPSNPGQFFACCGLLELADRLWDGAEGWFSRDQPVFLIRSISGRECDVRQLIIQVTKAGLVGELTPTLEQERKELEHRKSALKKENKKLNKWEEERRKELGKLLREGSIVIGQPFALRLDWWQEDNENIPKTWAGSQEVLRIARAAQASLPDGPNAQILDYACVMRRAGDDALADDEMTNDPTSLDRTKNEGDKVEPFYFDARRGANALARDIGFMPDSLRMTTVAYPAVEFFCLVGLQRFRPVQNDTKRVFEYFTWSIPLMTQPASLAVAGLLPFVGGQGYRFQIAFRTDQKKHKAFTPAIPIERSAT